jgi:subtilisin family serine protease
MKNLKISLFVLSLGLLIPSISFAETGDRIVYTQCKLSQYEEQLAPDWYLVQQGKVKKECIIKDIPEQKIYLASNDTQYPNQWALKNIGQTVLGQVGLAGKDIGFEIAYPNIANVPKGNTKIGLIDTGVTSIPDTASQIGGGFNMITNNSNVADDNGHGTFISSIIASQVNNGLGIAGINDRATIVPIKVLGSDGSGDLSDLIKGIQYAIDQNVNIINLSLATSSYTSSLNPIIEKAYQKGIIIVAAAGNGGLNITTPTVSPLNNDGNKNWIIGVGTIDNRGIKPTYANDGLGVDVLAPGDNVLGYNASNNGEYRSGTSISTAIVTGIISAWRDYYGTLTPEDAMNLINSSSQNRVISMSNAMIKRAYPNGALIRTANSGVYIVKQGIKRPIIDPIVFLSYYYRWEDISIVSQSVFDAIPTGDALSLREGVLIADKDKVYVIEQGLKRPIASPQVFLGLGYQWSNIQFPSQAVLNNHPTGALVGDIDTPPNGSVIYAEGTGAYLVENGRKKPFNSPYTFLSRYRWSDLMLTRRNIVDALPVGTDVFPQEGSVIRDNGAVYWVENDTKRPFASPQAFLGLGLSWGRVVYPPDVVLNTLKQGAIIQ